MVTLRAEEHAPGHNTRVSLVSFLLVLYGPVSFIAWPIIPEGPIKGLGEVGVWCTAGEVNPTETFVQSCLVSLVRALTSY